MNNCQKNVSCLSSHDALLSMFRLFRSSGAGGGRKSYLTKLEGAGFCRLASGGCIGGEEYKNIGILIILAY